MERIGFVILLVQMVRGVTAALGCGGLLGLVMALVGIGSLALVGIGSLELVGGDVSAISGLAFVLATAVAGPAFAVGALLRLLARRRSPHLKRAGP